MRHQSIKYSIFICGDTNEKSSANAQSIKMLRTRKSSKWNNTYLCQEILDMRIKRGARQYLIKWEGYQEKDNTWEPISNLIYILDDLVDFEQQNAAKLKQKEDQWKRMYEEKKVKEPLQPFQPTKLKKQIKIQPEPYSQTDSESIARTAKNKPVAKSRTRGGKCLERLHNQKTAKKEREKVTARRRGRPQKKMIASELSSEEDIPEDQQKQKKRDFQENSSSLSLSPEKSQFVDDRLRNIFVDCFENSRNRKSQKYPEQEKQPLNISPIPQNEVLHRSQQDNQLIYKVLTINDKKNSEQKYQKDEKDENNIIEEEVNERNVEESSKIQPSQELKKIISEENKNDSIFKSNYTKFPLFDTNSNASFSSPLHKGLTKYLYRRQKKVAKQQKCDSQSQSYHDNLKGAFQQKSIIEVEQQQKSSTPLVNLSFKRSQVDQNQKNQQDARSHSKNKSLQRQSILSIHSSIRQHKNEEDRQSNNSKQQLSEPIYQRLRSRENQKLMDNQNSSSEEQKQAENAPVILQEQNIDQKPNKIPMKIPEAIGTRYETLKRTNQRSQSKQFPLKSFDKKPKDPIHEIINLSASQSEHSSQRSIKIKTSNKPVALPKIKKIKKEIINSSFKNKQPSQDNDYFQNKQIGNVEFKPGLSAIFQMLLTVNELECHKNARIEKIISHFAIDKVIIFSVKISVSKAEPELRFATYQTIRTSFASDLLAYLQLKNCIML